MIKDLTISLTLAATFGAWLLLAYLNHIGVILL